VTLPTHFPEPRLDNPGARPGGSEAASGCLRPGGWWTIVLPTAVRAVGSADDRTQDSG